MFGTPVSDIQENVVVGDKVITGTLKYLSEGDLPTYWNANHFIALSFEDQDEADEIKVGITNPVALDSDMNGVWVVTDVTKPLKVIVTKGDQTETFEYDLSRLDLAPQE